MRKSNSKSPRRDADAIRHAPTRSSQNPEPAASHPVRDGHEIPERAHHVVGSGGDLLVEQLKAAGVRYLFTNPGSFEVGFFDAFLNQPGLQLINCLHEGIVISAADGYHKVSGEPAFVNVHVIAGSAQAAGQMYNASRDGSSIVVTAGLLDNEVNSDDVLLAARPGFEQIEVNRQFTKISWQTREPAAIPLMIRRAFKVSATPPGGPVYLALANYALEAKNVSGEIYTREHFMLDDPAPPNPAAIERAARALIEATDPAMYLGDEVWKSGAQQEALELAELLRIPVSEGNLTSFRSFPRRHELFATPFAPRGRDVVLNVGGADLGGGTVPTQPMFGTDTNVIRVSQDSEAIGRDNPFDIAILAHPKLALRALIDAIESMTTRERREQIANARPAMRQSPPTNGNGADGYERPYGPDTPHRPKASDLGLSPMHPDELGWALEEELDPDAIVVSENLSGSNHFLNFGFRPGEKMWVSSSGGGLGWGVGAAAGAKIAAPDRQVVCNIGDGSLMYSAAGFWTMARYEIPVLTVVCNNLNYQTVRTAYHKYGGKMRDKGQYCGMYLGDPAIDFAGLARSQGVDGVTVESSADLRAALRRGIAATRAGQPFLVDVRVRRMGGGAESTWHQKYSVADQRTRKV